VLTQKTINTNMKKKLNAQKFIQRTLNKFGKSPSMPMLDGISSRSFLNRKSLSPQFGL